MNLKNPNLKIYCSDIDTQPLNPGSIYYIAWDPGKAIVSDNPELCKIVMDLKAEVRRLKKPKYQTIFQRLRT